MEVASAARKCIGICEQRWLGRNGAWAKRRNGEGEEPQFFFALALFQHCERFVEDFVDWPKPADAFVAAR